MRRLHSSKVISANDLLSGEAVYLTKSGQWSPRHSAALLMEDNTVAAEMLRDVSGQGTIVGAYLAVAVADDSGQPAPLHYRDIFRTQGPSNLHHGKQADLN